MSQENRHFRRAFGLSCAAPRTNRCNLAKSNSLHFVNISETSLSRFLHFTICEGDETLREFLVRIEIAGIPDTRLDNIFKSIIDSRDKFFAYLRFLLTDELSKEDLEDEPPPKKKHKGDGMRLGF